MSGNKKIEVVPYDVSWPEQFAHEAALISGALQENCLAVHHVGSTSVPGLAAKPKIDILAVVRDPEPAIGLLERVGYEHRGEFNIPLHYCFSKRGGVDVNLHVYEEGNPEIELNLTFRDYLRAHPEVREAYAALKQELVAKESSHEKQGAIFRGYNLGKDQFIQRVLKEAGFEGLRIAFCTHHAEWEAARRFGQSDITGVHFALYRGTEIVGYAPVQLDPKTRVAIPIVVTEEPGVERHFLEVIEKWLARKGYQSIDQVLREVLGPNLLGVYLFGSAVVGGLQRYSDIDLLVVTKRATSAEEKRALIAELLGISGLYMKEEKRPLELTIVEQGATNPWRFDFQYGEWLRSAFEKGVVEPWESKEMPDLALIVTQVLLKSVTLWGEAPEKLLAPVPYRDFMTAMLHDVDRLAAELESDTRNVLLTFARIWRTLVTSEIRSKPAAAEWAIERLPEELQPVMERARAICVDDEEEHWEDVAELLRPCVDFIKAQLQESGIQSSDRSITLASQQHR